MLKRSSPTRLLLATLSSLTLILGSTACAVVQGLGEFKAASYLPKETWVFTSMTLRPSAAQMLHVKGIQDAYTSQPGFEDAWEALRSSSSRSLGVDFEKDILPLLHGEIALGVWGMLPESQPRWVTLVRSNDATKLLQILPLDGTRIDGTANLEKGYKDASFRSGQGGSVTGAAYKGWLILSDGRVPLEETIDRIESGGKDGLADTSRFKSAVERLPTDRLAYAYADLSPTLISSLAGLSGPSTAAILKKAQGRMGISVAAVAGGIESRAEWLPDEGISPLAGYARGNATTAFDQLPASTIAAYAGGSLPFLAQEGLASYHGLAEGDLGLPDEVAVQIAQLLEILGGEFAVGVGRDSIASVAGNRERPVDAEFVARLSNVEAARALLESVETSASEGTVHRLDDTFWFGSSDEDSAPVTFGVDGELLLVAGGLPEDVFARRSALGFGGNPRFQMVHSAIRPDTYDASFADLQAIREAFEEIMGESLGVDYARSIRPFLVPLRALGGSTVLEESGTTHGVAILAIRK